jgi:hypothetical protein
MFSIRKKKTKAIPFLGTAFGKLVVVFWLSIISECMAN